VDSARATLASTGRRHRDRPCVRVCLTKKEVQLQICVLVLVHLNVMLTSVFTWSKLRWWKFHLYISWLRKKYTCIRVHYAPGCDLCISVVGVLYFYLCVTVQKMDCLLPAESSIRRDMEQTWPATRCASDRAVQYKTYS
jgi:hypothetical protein